VGDQASILLHQRSPGAHVSPQSHVAISLSEPPLGKRAGGPGRLAGDTVVERMPASREALGRSASSILRPGKSSVILIDPRSLTRDSLGFWLAASLDGFTIRLAASPEEAAALADDTQDALLVLYHLGSQRVSDHAMAAGFASLVARLSTVPVAVLADDEDLDAIMAALRSGARGYIPTNLRPPAVIEAVRLICAGEVYAPTASFLRAIEQGSDLPGRLPTQETKAGGPSSRARSEKERPRAQADLLRFSTRQLEILRCLRRGIPNKCIAYELSMSQGTVKVHIRNIMKKLGARNRTQVVIMTSHLADEEEMG
jgi:DNA-binding NarL/FixJ family response regulator